MFQLSGDPPASDFQLPPHVYSTSSKMLSSSYELCFFHNKLKKQLENATVVMAGSLLYGSPRVGADISRFSLLSQHSELHQIDMTFSVMDHLWSCSYSRHQPSFPVVLLFSQQTFWLVIAETARMLHVEMSAVKKTNAACCIFNS